MCAAIRIQHGTRWIPTKATAPRHQVGRRRTTDAPAYVFRIHRLEHGLAPTSEKPANLQIMAVISNAHTGHRRIPFVLQISIQRYKAVVSWQPITEGFESQVTRLGKVGLELSFQGHPPKQSATVPFLRVGAADRIGVTKQELDGAALDVA